MSNSPKSPVVFRLPQSALTYTVLVLAIGALLLLSGGMDRNASVRAQFTLTPSVTFTPSITPTPVDPFANLEYTAWTSPDDLISLEHPATWGVQAVPRNGPVAYVILHPQVTNAGMLLVALPASQFRGIQDLSADTPLATYFELIFPGQQMEALREVELGDLRGVALRQTDQNLDAFTGQPVSIDSDIWLLRLDDAHFMIFQVISDSADWPRMEGVLNHILDTMRLDVPGIVAVLDETFAPTPTATGTPVIEPTLDATTAVTPGATTEPTSESPAEPTVEPTAVPTATPTATGTPSP